MNGYIRADYDDTNYTLISSASGSHTLTVNGTARESCWRLAEGVTLRYSNYSDGDFSYGYVKNADGSDDIERNIADGYAVYVGSGGGAVVTVWMNSWISNIDGSYVVFDNDANTHIPLTDTGTTEEYQYATYKCYTAPLKAGATTYTVYNSLNNALASGVNVSGGDIYISWTGGDNWGYKNW